MCECMHEQFLSVYLSLVCNGIIAISARGKIAQYFWTIKKSRITAICFAIGLRRLRYCGSSRSSLKSRFGFWYKRSWKAHDKTPYKCFENKIAISAAQLQI